MNLIGAMLILFYIVVLVFSVIVHEISHGVVALKLGDSTAKDVGRLTLNPLKHLDPIGSVILPLALALIGAPVIGWAKPVPYNPHRLPNPKRAAGIIAAAGPISNMLVAIIFSLLIRGLLLWSSFDPSSSLYFLFVIIIQTNIALAFFNLLPLPPLDGSGILFSLLPRGFYELEVFLRRYGIFILLFLIFFGVDFLSPLIYNTQAFLLGQ